MSTGEIPNINERLALCERLAPRIITATEAFFDSAQPHPYLEALANGGYITSHPDQNTEDTEYLTFMKATGHRDTLDPKMYESIGIPEEVAANGLMWVVMKKEAEYETDMAKNPAERRWNKTSHAFTYWDGSQWQTRRLKDDSGSNDPWETKWESSELTDEEKGAIKVVATQTQDVHSIAETFDGDKYAFEDMVLELPWDEYSLLALSRGLNYAFNSPRYGVTLPYDMLPAYMIYYGTGYQTWNLVETAHSLATHNSPRLDSGGIMAAMYHGSSTPPTPEMLEKGLNIPLRQIHPPVPADFIEA